MYSICNLDKVKVHWIVTRWQKKGFAVQILHTTLHKTRDVLLCSYALHCDEKGCEFKKVEYANAKWSESS